jgi:hypothetical protein
LMSEVPSPSLSGQPSLSTVEVPAAHGQSSTESSTPSPSESAPSAPGANAITDIKKIRRKPCARRDMNIRPCDDKKACGSDVHTNESNQTN